MRTHVPGLPRPNWKLGEVRIMKREAVLCAPRTDWQSVAVHLMKRAAIPGARTRRHPRTSKKPPTTICLESLSRFQPTETGKITSKKTTKDHHSKSFTYSISNRQALKLLEQITPFLHSYKKARSEFVLQHYLNLTPRNGYYTTALKKERDAFIESFFTILPHSK